MKVNPYITFNGDCEAAVGFYENAFGADATIMRYRDAPEGNGYAPPAGTENLVMHAQIELGGELIYFCDVPPGYPVTKGDNVAISVAFDCVNCARPAFAALSEGGEIKMELQKTFWSECFGSLTDKFGINWQVTVV